MNPYRECEALDDAPPRLGDHVRVNPKSSWTYGHWAYGGRTGTVRGWEGSRFSVELDPLPGDDRRFAWLPWRVEDPHRIFVLGAELEVLTRYVQDPRLPRLLPEPAWVSE